MRQNNKKLFIKIISILTITTGIIYASCSKHDSSKISYSNIPTIELQNEVEKLAVTDQLPFEMGIELMKRWQTGKSKIH
jgi:hypothetical protein